MAKVFHHRGGSRRTCWICICVFAGMPIVSVFGALDAPPANRVWLLFLMESVWLSMFTLSIWGLLATYRESWQLSEDRLVHQGIFRRQEVLFSQAMELKWRQWPAGGSVVLKSDTARIAFDVQSFEPTERVSLIRSLRVAVPEENQVGWPQFCQRWAVPLLDWLECDKDRPLQENEIRITRARYDRAIKIGLPVAVALMVPLAILLTQPALAFFPIFIIFLWVFLRMSVPKTGMIVKKPSSEPGTSRFITAIVVSGGTAVIGVFWIESQPQLFPNPIVPQTIISAIGIAGFVTAGYFADKSKRHHDEAAAPAAMERWETMSK